MFLNFYTDNGIETPGWYVAAFSIVAGSEKRLNAAEVRKWCVDTFGPEGKRWKDDLFKGEVRFKNENDLVIFAAKWWPLVWNQK